MKHRTKKRTTKKVAKRKDVTVRPNQVLHIARNRLHEVIPERMEVYMQCRYEGYNAAGAITTAAGTFFDIKLNSPLDPFVDFAAGTTGFKGITSGAIFPNTANFVNVATAATLVPTGISRYWGNTTALYENCYVLATEVKVNIITKTIVDDYYVAMEPWSLGAAGASTNVFGASENPFGSIVKRVQCNRSDKDNTLTHKVSLPRLIGVTKSQYLADDTNTVLQGTDPLRRYLMRVWCQSTDSTANNGVVGCDIQIKYHLHFRTPNTQLPSV